MSYNSQIITSIYGRRFGLIPLTSAQHGAATALSKGGDMLAGPEDVRRGVTTAEATGTDVPAWGVSNLAGTSAASSAVYVLEPPIPGVRKSINIGTSANGPIYLRTKNSETFNTTLGTSFTTIKSSAGGFFELLGITTAIWAAMGITSGTSSQGSGFILSTTT